MNPQPRDYESPALTVELQALAISTGLPPRCKYLASLLIVNASASAIEKRPPSGGLFSFDRTDRVYGECWRSSSGVGLGRGFGCGLVFWLGNPWNGQLFHVEQFGKGRKTLAFRCFLTGWRTDRQAKNTVGGPVFYGGISLSTVTTVFWGKKRSSVAGREPIQ